MGRVDDSRRTEIRRRLLCHNTKVKSNASRLHAANNLFYGLCDRRGAGFLHAVLHIPHQVAPVFLCRLAVYVRQHMLDDLTRQITLRVAEAVIVQTVDILHRRQQRGVLDHVAGILGKHVVHVSDVQRVAGVGNKGLCTAHILDLPRHIRALFGVLGGALLRRLDGPIVLLRELFIAVHLHAGLVAPCGQMAGCDLLQSLRNGLLHLRQRSYDGLQVVLRHADVFRTAGNCRVFPVPADLRLHNAAHHQMMDSLLPTSHQIVQIHDLTGGQCQFLSRFCGESVTVVPVLKHRLVREPLSRRLNGFQHRVLPVLRIAQRPEYLPAGFPIGAEKSIRVCQIQRQLAVFPLPRGAVLFQALRPGRNGLISLGRKALVEGGYALLDGSHRLPYGGQLLAVHVGHALVAKRHHLIQQPSTLAAQQVGVDHQRLAAPENFVISAFQGNGRLCPLGGVSLCVMYQPSVCVIAVRTLLIDAGQQRCHACPQIFRDVLLVRGCQQLAGKICRVTCDFGSQGGGIAPFPSGLGLLRIMPPHPLHLPVPALAGLNEHLRQPRLGLLQFQRLAVGKGRVALPHILADHAVDQKIGQLRHSRVAIPVKGIFIDTAHILQHLAHPHKLVACVDNTAGEIPLAEHLRQFGIGHVNVNAAVLADAQLSFLRLAPLGEIRYRAVIRVFQRGAFQMVADLQKLRSALRLYKNAVDDLLCRRSGVGPQGLHGYVVRHQRLAQFRHFGLDVPIIHAAAVFPDDIPCQFLHVIRSHSGRRSSGFLPPFLHSGLQRLVAGKKRRAFLLQLPHLLLQFPGGFQLEADVRVACGGQIVHVFELTAVKRHINSCVVIFPFDNVTVISQHLTRCF